MKTPLKLIRKDYPRIRIRIKGNTTSYEVDCRSVKWTGQDYYSFQSKVESIKKAQEVAQLVKDHGLSGINHEDIKLLKRVRKKLVPFHLGLEEAIDLFVESRAKSVAIQKTESMLVVTAEYLEDKSSGLRPLSDKTLIGIKTTCNALIKCFGDVPIGSITKEEVEKSIEIQWSNNSSRKDYVSRFRTFFKWAMSKKYIKLNPCGTKDKGDNIKVYSNKPDTLVLDHDSLLTILGAILDEPKMIPFYSLSLFAGMREAECKRIQWENIYLDERKTIFIPRRVSKTYEHNIIVHDTLIEWLQPYIGKPIVPDNHRKLYDSIREDIAWQRDIMRHTATSYFMGKYENIYQVSEWLGNSPTMIKKHYQVPLLKSDVEWFWSLTPTKVKELIEERKKKHKVVESHPIVVSS